LHGTVKISVDRLDGFTRHALRMAGLNEDDARTTAELLVLTDTWGVFTHGTKNLRGYIRRLKGGGIRAQAKPRVVAEGPAWAMVDADSAIGMVGSSFAMRVAMEKARGTGVGYVGVRNSCHFGAAGCYTAMAASEGLIGVAMANDTPSVVVPGARRAVLGSNPFSFAVPTGEKHPILLDIATSAVAGGKVFTAAALGKEIPDNWIVDADGLPTTNPNIFPRSAALLPMAGHKGSGLAVFIETLSGIVTGASIAAHVLSWSFDDPTVPTGHGAAFLAIDVRQMMGTSELHSRMGELMRQIRQAPRAKGVDRLYFPGEIEWERRERALRDGIELPEDVLAPLRLLAEELGMEW
jgi:LDH2 family malate/lactate/ureidoglycolate dehydrogenase